MDKTLERLDVLLMEVAERTAKTCTTAAEVESLSSVAQALIRIHEVMPLSVTLGLDGQSVSQAFLYKEVNS